MKSLSKSDQKERDDFVNRLRAKMETIDDLVQAANDAIDAVNEAISDYNATVDDVNSWAQDLIGQMEDYRDGRTEKWQESDDGQQYDNWIQSWADELAPADELDKLEPPIMEAAGELEQRTIAPDEM